MTFDTSNSVVPAKAGTHSSTRPLAKSCLTSED
jgi:hypothetical protein